MKSSFQATAFLLAVSSFCLASITAVPTPSALSSTNIVSAAGSTGHDHVSITFDVPCPDCLNANEDGLELNLVVEATESGCCGESVYVNGIPLALDPAGARWTGPQTFPSGFSQRSDVSDIEAFIFFKCMKDQAAFLSVAVTTVAGKDVSLSRSGFTASFNQSDRPQILRLQSAPRSYIQDISTHQDEWISPNPEDKFVIEKVPSGSPSAMPEGLDQEIYKLDILKNHLKALQKEINKQEKTIMGIWRDEFSKCATIKCYLRTAVEKAPILAHLIANHFRHHSHIDIDFFHKGAHVNCSDQLEQLITQPNLSEVGQDELDDASVQQTRPTTSAVRSVDVAAPTPAAPSAQPENGDQVDKIPEHSGGSPPWMHGGRPPWAKPGSRPPWAGPRWHGGPPPWVHTDHSHNPFKPQLDVPHSFIPELTSQQIWRIHLIGAMIGLLVVLLFTACIFTCIKHKARIFRDPRRRVELMARREEWIKRRAFRKAACKHRFWTFLKTLQALTSFTSKSEEEEKQAMLAPQEDVVVTREVRDIRAAHQLVGDMMRAEEGESRFTITTRHQRSGSESESLPSYRSGPPGYASGLEGDISVIDGFTGYTPSNTDETPTSDSESSIVDLSPRMSFETQRTA